MVCTGPGPDDWVQANPNYNCGTPTQRDGFPVTVNATLKGYTCPADQGQQCIAPLDNAGYGFNGFDNYGEALLYMMQVQLCVRNVQRWLLAHQKTSVHTWQQCIVPLTECRQDSDAASNARSPHILLHVGSASMCHCAHMWPAECRCRNLRAGLQPCGP